MPRTISIKGNNPSSEINSVPFWETLDCRYNQAAFVAPPLAGHVSAHEFGDSRLGNLRGPDLVTFDLALQKNFLITERQQIEFRAEMFDLFNHPNFGLPGGGSQISVDFPGGAAITNTAIDNRQIEFALKYAF